MHKSGVIDLRNYQSEEIESDPGSDFLHAGTMLLHGQYTITGYLKCGGFGITYRATDSLGRDVVIKECFPGALCQRSGNLMSPRETSSREELDAIVGQFMKEARRQAGLSHDNIVHVHQVFEENDTAYMAMDFIDGPDLLDILESSAQDFAPSDITYLTEAMLHAVKYLHDQGVLHRDLSPDNILVTAQGEPVLIDFGSAQDHAASPSRDPSRLKFVKDGYSPQEFYIVGSEHGPWSDLYSLAASLYHLITGAAPIDGQTRLAALASNTADPYVPLADQDLEFSKPFLRAIDQAMEAVPEKRLQSADDWLAILASDTTASGTGDRGEPLVLATLKRGRWIGLAAAAALFVAVGAGALWYAPSLSSDNHPAGAQVAMPDVAAPLPDVRAEGRTLARIVEPDGSEPPLVTKTTAPIALGALLPTAPDKTGVPPERTRSVPRVARIDTLPLREVELVSLPPAQASVTGVTDFRPSGTGEAPSLLTPETSVTVVAPMDGPEVPTSGDRPDAVRQPARPVVLAHVVPDLPEPNQGEVPRLTMTNLAQVPEVPYAAGPHLIIREPLVSLDTTPPAQPVEAPLAPVQVVYADWDVDMPFASEPEQIRSFNTIRITEVIDQDALSRSGNWLKKNVILYTFNGQDLQPGMSLSSHILNTLTVDDDGYVRAPVRYRDPDSGAIGLGTLALPVVRRIGLADGSLFEARLDGIDWRITVKAVGRETDRSLRVGDVLEREVTTGIALGGHEELGRAISQLVEQQIGTARFRVRRGDKETEARLQLARREN